MAYKKRYFGGATYAPSQWTRKYTDYNGNVTVSTYGPWTETSQRMYKISQKYRRWYTTPGWKALLASQGYLPTQQMDETQWQWWQPYPTVTFVNRVNGNEDRRIMTGTSYYVAPATALGMYNNVLKEDVKADAQQKCLAKARDMKVNVAVALGEGRQTVRMIAETARTLGKAYRNFRRGRFKQAARDLGINKPSGTAANHWLAYAYGWSPLLSDAKGLAELAAQQLELGGRKPRTSVRASSTQRFTSKFLAVGQGPSCLNDGDSLTSGETTYKGNAGLLLELQYSSAALAAQTGFGLTDPLLLAWELTPFSFVFDWFIDVGGQLEMLSALQGWTVLTGFSSCEQSFTGRCSMPRIWSGWDQEGSMPSFPVHYREYNRLPWTGSLPSIRAPLWDGLNARRLTTTAALWRQRTKGDRLPGKYRP